MITTLLLGIISILFKVIYLAIIVDALLSWIPGGGNALYNIRNFLRCITEPVLAPIRSVLMRTPLRNLPIDFSPIIAIVLLEIIETLLRRLVYFVL